MNRPGPRGNGPPLLSPSRLNNERPGYNPPRCKRAYRKLAYCREPHFLDLRPHRMLICVASGFASTCAFEYGFS